MQINKVIKQVRDSEKMAIIDGFVSALLVT